MSDFKIVDNATMLYQVHALKSKFVNFVIFQFKFLSHFN